MRRLIAILLFAMLATSGEAGEYTVTADIPYLANDGHDEYSQRRCKLDLYLPKDSKGFATMVWFHGGSIRSGEKDGKIAKPVAERFASDGIAVVSVNYRLSPQARYPAYIEDCAASVAWTLNNIAKHGGDAKKVFVSGHSAGGYLAAMVGMDQRYLEKHFFAPDDVAGYISVAGQMITHSTVRAERGIGRNQPIIDSGAPCFFVRKDAPPFLCLVGDDDLPARLEENRFFVASLEKTGNKTVEYHLGKNRNHGSIASLLAEPGDPGAEKMLEFIRKHSK